MPRKPRKISPSGIYHVMMRGINKNQIFFDEEDSEKFLSSFTDACKEYNVTLYAWCLMPNHVHLLLKDKQGNLSALFRKFGSFYVWWYNRKYDRVGHLFEDRFKSEPVGSPAYFIKAVRYIHMNPVKANICQQPGEYKYSSFFRYFESDLFKNSDVLFGLMKKEDLFRFHFEKNNDTFLDIEEETPKILRDEDVLRIIKTFGINEVSQLRTLPKNRLELVIRSLLNRGAALRQLYRLTGISIRQLEEIKNQ